MTAGRFESQVVRIVIQVVLVGLVMVSIGGLLFLVGGFLLPGEPDQVGSESPTVSSTAVEPFVLRSLEDLEGTTAVVVVDGDIRGRSVLIALLISVCKAVSGKQVYRAPIWEPDREWQRPSGSHLVLVREVGHMIKQ